MTSPHADFTKQLICSGSILGVASAPKDAWEGKENGGKNLSLLRRVFLNGWALLASPSSYHVLSENDEVNEGHLRRCIYCGGSFTMNGHCSFSPNGKHSLGVQ